MQYDWPALFSKHLHIVPMNCEETSKDPYYNELHTVDCHYLLQKIMAKNNISFVFMLHGISAFMVWMHAHASELQTCDTGHELYFENVAYVD